MLMALTCHFTVINTQLEKAETIALKTVLPDVPGITVRNIVDNEPADDFLPPSGHV
ncbi:hypothetical protein ACHAP5_010471 [Fusarium lateritium]